MFEKGAGTKNIYKLSKGNEWHLYLWVITAVAMWCLKTGEKGQRKKNEFLWYFSPHMRANTWIQVMKWWSTWSSSFPPPPTCLESSRQRAGAIIDATVSAQVSRASEQKDGQEELHLPVILPFPSVLSDSGEDWAAGDRAWVYHSERFRVNTHLLIISRETELTQFHPTSLICPWRWQYPPKSLKMPYIS